MAVNFSLDSKIDSDALLIYGDYSYYFGSVKQNAEDITSCVADG